MWLVGEVASGTRRSRHADDRDSVPAGDPIPQPARLADERVQVHGLMVVSEGSHDEGHRLPVPARHRARGVVVDRARRGGPRMGVPLADVTQCVVGPGTVEVGVQRLLGGAFASQVRTRVKIS